MNILLLNNFTVSVAGQTRVSVKELTLGEGELCALVGPNGSGKSSLLSAVMTMPGMDIAGRAEIFGNDISNTTLDQKARDGAIYISQALAELEGLTLIQLLYGMYKQNKEDAVSIIDFKNDLAQKIKKYNLAEELLLRSVGHGLSGGEKKQMELVTLIANQPKLALIDEIDSGIDVNMIESVVAVLEDLKAQGAAILIVSHNFELLKKLMPSKIYMAESGQINLYGTAKKLSQLSESGFIKQSYEK